MLPRRASPDVRIATLGATRDFHHRLLVEQTPAPVGGLELDDMAVRVAKVEAAPTRGPVDAALDVDALACHESPRNTKQMHAPST